VQIDPSEVGLGKIEMFIVTSKEEGRNSASFVGDDDVTTIDIPGPGAHGARGRCHKEAPKKASGGHGIASCWNSFLLK
jgi:hypothetical protein